MLRRRIAANEDLSVARDQIFGGGIRAQAPPREELLQHTPCGGARRRRDRGRRAAAVGRAARGKLRIADADGDLVGMKSEHFGDGLSQHRANSGADILHAGQHFHRAVAHDAHLAGGVGLHIGAPQRLRHAETALYRPGIRAGRVAVAASRSARRRCGAPRAEPGSDRSGRATRADRCRDFSASSSIVCSKPNAPGVLPGPRIAQPGPALMNTSCCAASKFGQEYIASALLPMPAPTATPAVP